MMNTPKIRFSGYTEAWEQRKLETVATFSKGNGYSKGDLIASGTPIILYGRLYTKYETSITEVDTFVDAKQGSVYSKGGEVIIPASGETAEDIARASTVENAGVLLGGDLNVVTPNEDIDSAFLALSISNGESHKELAKKAQGKSVVHIHNAEIMALNIPFPSKVEQSRISDYFFNLDNLITLHQRKCDQTKKLKKYMLQKMFPQNGELYPEIRFEGFTEAWEQRKCEGILRPEKGAMKIGPFGSALKKEFYTEVGVKVYAQENIFQEDFSIGNYYISDERYQTLKGCKLEAGDLVISMMGTIGACAIFPEDAEPGIMNSHLLRLQLKDDIYPEYIHQLLRDSQLIRKQIDRLSVGSIMSGLSSSVVQKLVFPVPCIEEQKKIAEFLVHIDNLITLHQRKCDDLKEIKKYMLQNMFAM